MGKKNIYSADKTNVQCRNGVEKRLGKMWNYPKLINRQNVFENDESNKLTY